MQRMMPAFMVVLIALPAVAQQEDFYGAPALPQCEISEKWRVIGTEIGDTPGMTMDVNARDAAGQPDCKTKGMKPDFTIGGPDEALWMTSLSADYLVMARSTGPVGKLVIQSLNDKSVIVEVTSNDSQADSWGVTYWEQKEVATAENCTEFARYAAEGFTAVVAHEMRFDFASKTSLTSGKTACEPQQ